MKKVAAVVVTYNRIELLKECLNALKVQSYPCDILVVDNASIDRTGEYIKQLKINATTFITKIQEQISAEQADLILACAGQLRKDMNMYG